MFRLLLFTALFLTFSSKAQYPDGFSIALIDRATAEAMQQSGVYQNEAPVPLERLRQVRVRYLDFEGQEQQGQVIVLDACSEATLKIFHRLYQREFPIHSLRPIQAFEGNDSLSMAANNSSAFNFRPIAGSAKLSLHAYGTAIDINPVHNPMLDIACGGHSSCVAVRPAAGAAFANRRQDRLNKAPREGMAEEVLDIFAQEGFYAWGGYWDCPIDYQHFEVSRSLSELLAALPPKKAKYIFHLARDYFNTWGYPLESVWADWSEAGGQYLGPWILTLW